MRSAKQTDFDRVGNLYHNTIFNYYILVDYHKEIEKFIDTKKDNYELSKNDDDEFFDPVDAMENEIRLYGGYQDILRNSIFVLLFSFVEDFLYTVYEDLSKTRGEQIDSEISGISKLVKILSNSKKNMDILSNIKETNKIYNKQRIIRNFIIHNNSIFSNKLEKEIIRLKNIIKNNESEVIEAKKLYDMEIERCKKGNKENKSIKKKLLSLKDNLKKNNYKLVSLENKLCDNDYKNINELEKIVFSYKDYFSVYPLEDKNSFPAKVILKKEYILQIINTHLSFFESVRDSLSKYYDKNNLKYKYSRLDE